MVTVQDLIKDQMKDQFTKKKVVRKKTRSDKGKAHTRKGVQEYNLEQGPYTVKYGK